jgi:hypothetical protein
LAVGAFLIINTSAPHKNELESSCGQPLFQWLRHSPQPIQFKRYPDLNLEPLNLTTLDVFVSFDWVRVAPFAIRETGPPSAMTLANVAPNLSAVAVDTLSTVAKIVATIRTTSTILAVPTLLVIARRTAPPALAIPFVRVSWRKWLDNNWMHRSGIHAFIFAHSFSFAAR